jgi:hypothetical protein
MTTAEWISAANKRLKANPNLTYQQVEQQLAEDGFKRPAGITQKGSSKSGRRFGTKAQRTPGQDQRRAAQEQVSTEAAAQQQQTLKKIRQEQQGIADYAGMAGPHREHLYSQDISGEITEGAPGDYVENVPADIAAAKTALEQRIRTRYNNRYAVGLGVNGLRVIPRKFWDERVNPDDLPGIDIDETNSLEDQLGVLKSIAKQTPLQTPPQEKPKLPPTTTQQKPTVLPKAKPASKVTVPTTPAVTPKQNLSIPVMSAEQVRSAVGFNQNIQSAVTFGLNVANGVVRFGQAVGSVVSALAATEGR